MDVYMDPVRVQRIADGFSTAADILRTVSRALETAMNILQTTAFIGMVGGYAVERYLSVIQPQIDQLAQFCEETNQEVAAAVQRYIEATETGAEVFD